MTLTNRSFVLVGIVAALAIAGGLSYFASEHPDGLEKTQEDLGAGEPIHGEVAPVPSPFEEYGVAGVASPFVSNAAAGIAGTLVVLVILLGVGRLLRRPSGAVKAPAER